MDKHWDKVPTEETQLTLSHELRVWKEQREMRLNPNQPALSNTSYIPDDAQEFN